MNPQLLLAHFVRISEAPDAAPRLRGFILDLAVRGKLVDQNADDEPPSKLLKSSETERTQPPVPWGIIKQGANFDVPFEIPRNWIWVPLGNVCSKTGSGSTPRGGKSVYQPDGVPFLRSQNVYDDGLRLDDVAYITHQTQEKMSGTAVRTGDLLLNITGGSIGRCCLVPSGLGQANVSQHVAILRVAVDGMQRYLHRLILSPYFQSFVLNEQTGAGRGGLPKNRMDRIPVALPPQAEQHRIVARVDELMALCDRLEMAQDEREQRRDRLVSASLHHLNNGGDSDALRHHARFYLNHLPRLTRRPDEIYGLRQTILNLAVRGRLACQDSNDEPASELLKRIQAEKAQLVKEGKIKKDKPLPKISEAEKLFLLPRGWEWVRMQAVFDVRDGTHDTPRYVEGDGVPLITSRNFLGGTISFDDAKLISWSDHNSIKKRSGVERGDILYSMIGGNIGNQVLVETDREFSIKNVALFKYYTKKDSLPKYLNLFLKTVTIGLQKAAVGGAQPFVSLSLLRNIPLPMPPLTEQRRIVAKVDELMALCDRLEAQLNLTQNETRRLLEAVLYEALSDNEELKSRLKASNG